MRRLTGRRILRSSHGRNWKRGMTADMDAAAASPRHNINPRYVRRTHWTNGVGTVMMIGSGWQIDNASALFGFTFPKAITLGGWLAGGLLWHFAAMWLLIANGAVYVTLALVTGRFRQRFLPILATEVVR